MKLITKYGLLSILCISNLSNNTIILAKENSKDIENVTSSGFSKIKNLKKEINKLEKLKEITKEEKKEISSFTVSEIDIDNALSRINNIIDEKESEIDTIEEEISSYQKLLGTYKKIEEYSRVYELDEEIIISKFIELTNNFDQDWFNNHIINEQEYSSEDEAIIYTIHSIYKNPKKYDLNKEIISSNKEYESDLIIEDIVEKYCTKLKGNKEICLSIMVKECGENLNSANLRVNNNPAGIGPHEKFKNLEHGICEFVIMMKDRCSLKEDSGLDYISNIFYNSGDDAHWRIGVKGIYKIVKDNYYYYYENHGKRRKVLKKEQ